MDPQLATFGIWEMVIILLIVVVLFGATRLPQLGGALGKAIRNFRKSFKDEPREIQGEARRIEPVNKAGELPPGELSSQEERMETAEKTADHQ